MTSREGGQSLLKNFNEKGSTKGQDSTVAALKFYTIMCNLYFGIYVVYGFLTI